MLMAFSEPQCRALIKTPSNLAREQQVEGYLEGL